MLGFTRISALLGEEEKMRFKLIPRCLLFAELCVCLTSGELWLRNGLAFNTGRIVFTSMRDGTNEIYVMDADGKNPIRLTDELSEKHPDWSPDGQKIAFTVLRDKEDLVPHISRDGC